MALNLRHESLSDKHIAEMCGTENATREAVLDHISRHERAHGFTPTRRETIKALSHISSYRVEIAYSWLAKQGRIRKAY